MSQQKGRKINYPKGGMVEDLTLRIKLILRLMGDSRVSIFLKVLPVVTLVYLLFPDLLLGPVDDVAIIWLGAYLFVELCPPEVVQEHVDALRAVIPGAWRDVQASDTSKLDKQVRNGSSKDSLTEDEAIVDVEFWDKKDE